MHPESRLSKFYDTLKTALVQYDRKEVGSMRLLTEEWLDAEMTRRVTSYLNLNLKVRLVQIIRVTPIFYFSQGGQKMCRKSTLSVA